MLWCDTLSVIPLAIKVITSVLGLPGLLTLYVEGPDEHWGVFTYLSASASSLRFLKTTNYLLGMQILKAALRPSLTALVIPAYLLLMLLTFFGTLIFAVVPHHTPEPHSRVHVVLWT
jgi:hypothetical protein